MVSVRVEVSRTNKALSWKSLPGATVQVSGINFEWWGPKQPDDRKRIVLSPSVLIRPGRKHPYSIKVEIEADQTYLRVVFKALEDFWFWLDVLSRLTVGQARAPGDISAFANAKKWLREPCRQIEWPKGPFPLRWLLERLRDFAGQVRRCCSGPAQHAGRGPTQILNPPRPCACFP